MKQKTKNLIKLIVWMLVCDAVVMTAAGKELASPAKTFPKVPKSEYLDTENSLFQKIDTSPGKARQVSFFITCDTSPVGALRLLIGRDADGNGKLALHETDLEFGWECAAWILRIPDDIDLRGASQTPNARKRLELRLQADAKGACTHLDLLDGDTSVLKPELRAQLAPTHIDTWNLVRIVRNGTPEPNEETGMTVLTKRGPSCALRHP